MGVDAYPSGMQTPPFPRRARILAFVAILALIVVWITPSLSAQDIAPWTNPGPTADALSSTGHPVPTKTSASPIENKVAVIIEDRNLTSLMPVIMHFHTVLGPSWPIVLYTRPSANLDSAPFQRAVRDGRIIIKYIPAEIKLKRSYDVSHYLTMPGIWEELAPAKRVLLFQADSMICANSPTRVDEFLEYDLVGAPIREFYGEGYNGGLSLRNREMILDIIRTGNWTKEKEEYEVRKEAWKAEQKANSTDISNANTIPGVLAVDMEDQWFYQKMKARNAHFPPVEIAQKFAVETTWYDWPLGYHQTQRYYGGDKARMEHIDKWCPEHRLCTDDFIYLHPNGDEPPKEEPKKEESKEDSPKEESPKEDASKDAP